MDYEGSSIQSIIAADRKRRREARHDDARFRKSCNEDLFSAITKDCLFTIFRYLDSESFETMSRVSQKMHHISTSPGVIKAKREFYELFLTLDGDGFIFYLNEKAGKRQCLVYDASAPEVTRRILPRKENDLENENAKPITACIINSFSAALDDILSKFRFDVIRIDTNFVEKCLPIIQKHKLREMSLCKPSFEDNISPSILIHESLFDLTVDEVDSRTFSMFDEQFVREFSAFSDTEQKYSLHVDESEDSSFQWTPGRGFLPILCRYEEIDLSSLTLTIPLLMELISISLGKVSSFTDWSFSVTDELTEADFAQLEPSITVEMNRDDGETKFIVKNPALNAQCTITLIDANSITMDFLRIDWICDSS